MNNNGSIVGNPSYVAGDAGFGSTLSVAGNNSGFSLPIPGPLDFPSGSPFTVECRFKTSATSGVVLFARQGGFGSKMYVFLGASSVQFVLGDSFSLGGSVTVADNNPHKLAVCYDGTTAYLFLDGALLSSGATTYSGNGPGGTSGFGYFDGTNYSFTGTIDEVRISRVARYTANYTPATAPFVDDAVTTALYHLDGTGSPAAGATVPDSHTAPMPSTLHIGAVGDSITAGYMLTTPATQAPIAQMAGFLSKMGGLRNVAFVNQGYSGSTTTDWLPAGTLLAPAKAAFVAAFGTASPTNKIYVPIRLGVNDAKASIATSASQYNANLTAICESLTTDGFIPALNYPTFVNTAAGDLSNSGGSNALLAAYCAQLDVIGGTVRRGIKIIAGDKLAYSYFRAHSEEQLDGLHPNATGAATLGLLDATALYGYLATAGTASNAVVGVASSKGFGF